MIKKLGERIKRIRINKDFTLANMAEELGMTTSAYSKIERGVTNPPASRLIQIAEILEVNVKDFFEDPVPNTVVEAKNLYGFATKDELAHLTHLVQTLLIEFEKLREELPAKAEKKKKKKN